jgi:GNAT superfamily N-acetyltransferase
MRSPSDPPAIFIGVRHSRSARMVGIRQLHPEELARVEAIDVSESGRLVYYHNAGQIMSKPTTWQRAPRDAHAWGRYVERWQTTLARAGVALGAFDGERLVGIAVLRHHLTESMAQLEALFVSRDSRRRGIASQLMQETLRLAKAAEASHLYVSATPSESAVGFYLRQGFVLAPQVHEGLYALEPEDLHLLRAL